MTNAADASIVLPGRPPIALRPLAGEKSLVIEAWDHSPLDLEPRPAEPDAECGRGLTVVAALTARVGSVRAPAARSSGQPWSPAPHPEPPMKQAPERTPAGL